MLSLMQNHVKILVVGAGGLGCELLKDLALMGFCDLHVIDMDTIDLSNLNRQFLFRKSDVGKPKAEVAAGFINSRVPSCKVTPHYSQISDFGQDFYRQFNVVVCGLDSIPARRWINSMLASLVKYDKDGKPDPGTVIPLVDGGTEGFKGNCLVVLHGLTGCLECTLDLYPPQVNFPLCTIAHTPRLPEHCIEFVKILLWHDDKPFGDAAVDGDNPEHLQWIFEKASQRADQYSIPGVNMRLVKGVVKSIIPAVASTNAVIAAACATEVFKLVTFTYDYLNNYCNFSDLDGVYTYSFPIESKEDCLVCNTKPRTLSFKPSTTLQELIDYLIESSEYRMKSPSVSTTDQTGNRSLYIPHGDFKDNLKPNLKKSLQDLKLVSGQELLICDETTPRTMIFHIEFLDEMKEKTEYT